MTDTSVSPAKRYATAGDYVQLLKPRIMMLVVFTAVAGLIAAVGVTGQAINPVMAAIATLAIALGSGAALSGSELGVMGGILAGTVACGASMSWYCERFVGELSWRPAARALRVSTLNVWGNRKDRDIPVAQLASLLALDILTA